MTPTELYYRKTAAASSGGGLGLLIALYDTLAGDLLRMIEAERGNDLAQRCREANHALMIIGCLEDRVTRGSSGELADQLMAFYASLRRNLILAQANRSPDMIEEQLAQVLKLREAWQAVEMRSQPSSGDLAPSPSTQKFGATATDEPERDRLSWSA